MSCYKAKINKENSSLVWQFFVNPKSCNNPKHYEDYLRYNALSDINDGLGVTYLYIDHNDESNEDHIMGYITLRTTAYIKDVGESKKFGFPALEISELAVDKRYEGNHIGTDMVMDAINIANDMNDTVSVKYIVLCADPRAESFYKHEPLEFCKMYDGLEDIPREHFNMECVPMYIKLR